MLPIFVTESCTHFTCAHTVIANEDSRTERLPRQAVPPLDFCENYVYRPIRARS